MMVLCEIDSVGILVEPLRSKTAGKTTRAFEKLIDRLSKQRIKTKNIVLDNEISGEFKKAVDNRQLTYQLVPPNDHRRSRADRAIQTFKAHFISILCDVDEKFPIELWCRLLTQADLILNLLRPATHTPNVSANAYLFGKFNYNTHPLAPLGTAVEMNLVPTARETWAPHSATGYHVGVSLEHYRCYRELIKAMRSKRIGHTVFFKHKYLTMPTITNADALLITAKDLQTALKGGVPQALQLTAAVRQLMEIFKANAEAAQRKEQESESQRVQRERALRERLQMDHEHAEAAATEEPPKLVNRDLDENSDPDNEDDNAGPEFEIVPTATPPGPPAGVPMVSQDDDVADTPAANTRARSKLRTVRSQCQSGSNNGFDRSSEYTVPRAAFAGSVRNQT